MPTLGYCSGHRTRCAAVWRTVVSKPLDNMRCEPPRVLQCPDTTTESRKLLLRSSRPLLLWRDHG